MNKIDKYLTRLLPNERHTIVEIIEQLASGDLSRLNIKKLKGLNGTFRVRKGGTRIIFHFDDKGRVVIEYICRRRENTY